MKNIAIAAAAVEEMRAKFLITKKVLKSNPEKLILQINRLNFPHLAPADEQDHYKSCQDRLDRVINVKGDRVGNEVPNDVQTFEEFCSLFPEWGDSSKSFVFHRDHASVSGKASVLMQRATAHGLCYFHAPSMVQHYCVSMCNPESAGMIDFTKHIRDGLSAEELESYIFKDKGGDSIETLRRILLPDSDLILQGFFRTYSNLKKYGPALISQFKVDAAFADQSIHSHSGRTIGTLVGKHAWSL